MIVCITAPPRGIATGSGPSPRGVMDFATGTYSFDGTTLTSADCIDHPEYISAGALDIDPGAGASSVAILGDFATFLGGCQFTAVFTVEILTATAPTLFAIENFAQGYIIESEWNGEFKADDSAAISRFADDFTHATGAGVHTLALTRTNAKLCLSVDGNAIGDSPTGTRDDNALTLPVASFPMDNFHLGGYSGGSVPDHIKIRRVAFYDPVDDTALPGLSA